MSEQPQLADLVGSEQADRLFAFLKDYQAAVDSGLSHREAMEAANEADLDRQMREQMSTRPEDWWG